MTYYEENKDRILKRAKKYYENNRERCLNASTKYAKNNRDKVRQNKKKHKDKNKKRAKRFIQLVKKIFGCSQCGYNKNICSLDFHHLKDKKYLVSRMMSSGYTIKLIKNEIKKCRILCSNCHRKEHSENKKYTNKKWQIVNDIKLKSKCQMCNESDSRCLDFHHTHSKDLNISQMIRTKDIDASTMINEIEKCIVLCSNCHREHHNKE